MSGAENAIRAFWAGRARTGGANAARFHDAHTPLDQALLLRFAEPGTRVLDLGCGTCVLANWLVAEVGATVHAVDAEAAFLAGAIDHPALTTEVALIEDYRPAGVFDLVMLFGVVNYIVDPARRDALYRRLRAAMAPGGVLAIKSQFGVNGTVTVDRYSEVLGTTYYAVYPHLDAEIALLSDTFAVEIADVYPPHFSPHTDTRFSHLIARRVRPETGGA